MFAALSLCLKVQLLWDVRLCKLQVHVVQRLLYVEGKGDTVVLNIGSSLPLVMPRQPKILESLPTPLRRTQIWLDVFLTVHHSIDFSKYQLNLLKPNDIYICVVPQR
jgi:hypothetical protein